LNPIALQQRTELVKKLALEQGFSYVGISKADFLEEEAPRLETWLRQGKHGQMQWMENHFDKRLDPRKLVEGAKSVISLLYCYYPKEEIFCKEDDFKVSKYAYGRDYHKVIKKKMKHYAQALQEALGEFQGRAFVDSAPVMDKAWAVRSGLGWMGKNTNVITKRHGSFYFISELILDIELEADGPIQDFCRNCRLCQDACPTGALDKAYEIDGERCISYLTIELKENIPTAFAGKFENWIYGCDVCQDVCPWNRRAKPHTEPDFLPREGLAEMQRKDWEELTEAVFDELFRGSAVKRTKFEGLKRNIRFVASPPPSSEQENSRNNA